ncbi:MAG: ChaN family lipoprotein [Magnetococcales bacterium]|nr:ChaN family lipoprotein [Magnetococcales bacterium]
MAILPLMGMMVWLQIMGMGGMGGVFIETGEILEIEGSRRIEQVQLMDRLAARRIVLVGETHDDPGHHEVQRLILGEMLDRGRDVALAMEMFPGHLQPQLDRWVAGGMAEDEFLDAVSWYFTWGFDAELYLPILRLARERKVPLLAMNIDRAVVSQVRTRGFDSLDRMLLDRLPVLAPALPEYRERLRAVFDSHPMMARGGSLENFIDAQRLWDGVMAGAIADWVRRHPRGQVIALAGSGHLLMKHGIPHQLASMGLAAEMVTVLPWNDRDQPFPDRGADFVWGTSSLPTETPRQLLGVQLEAVSSSATAGRIVITAVTPDSPAQRGGLKPGDQPLRLDHHPLPHPHSLVRLLRARDRNPRPVLTFLRDNRVESVVVDLEARIPEKDH